jgi:hypothetical protein
MSCPYHKRGHRWGALATLPAFVRICQSCGSLGRIARDGTTKVIWEPEPCGTTFMSQQPHWTCGLPCGHSENCTPGLGKLDPSSPMRQEHACDKPRVREVIERLQTLARAYHTSLGPEEYLERRSKIVRELVGLLV